MNPPNRPPPQARAIGNFRGNNLANGPVNLNYSVRRHRFAGQPFSIGVTALDQGGPPHQVISNLVLELRHQIRFAANSVGVPEGRVTGFMAIENILDGAAHSLDDPVAFDQIDEELIDQLLLRVQQSNADISIFDVEIVFVFSAASMVAGAAFEEKTGAWPGWLPRTARFPTAPKG